MVATTRRMNTIRRRQIIPEVVICTMVEVRPFCMVKLKAGNRSAPPQQYHPASMSVAGLAPVACRSVE